MDRRGRQLADRSSGSVNRSVVEPLASFHPGAPRSWRYSFPASRYRAQ